MRSRTVLGILAVGSIVFFTFIWRLPNFDIGMSREIPLEAPAPKVSKVLENLREWPAWHHGIRAITGHPVVGEKLVLHFASPIRPWKHHELEAQVMEWIPGKKVTLQLTHDSSGKLNKMVSDLTWSIELREKSVLANIHAHTRSFRARLLSYSIPHIFLNQLLYPNIIQLAKAAPLPTEGFSLNPTPPN